MARVPVYNDPNTFFSGLTDEQIQGKDEVTLWVKTHEWRISFSAPATNDRREWKKATGAINTNAGTGSVEVSVRWGKETRTVIHTLNDKDKQVLSQPNNKPGDLWVRKSQYQKAFRNKPDNNGGGEELKGQLPILGPT